MRAGSVPRAPHLMRGLPRASCERALPLALPTGGRSPPPDPLPWRLDHVQRSWSCLCHPERPTPIWNDGGMRARRSAYTSIKLGFPGAGYPLGVPGPGVQGWRPTPAARRAGERRLFCIQGRGGSKGQPLGPRSGRPLPPAAQANDVILHPGTGFPRAQPRAGVQGDAAAPWIPLQWRMAFVLSQQARTINIDKSPTVRYALATPLSTRVE
jgi:hypothetical protein